MKKIEISGVGNLGCFFSRQELTARWKCSNQTIINYEKTGKLRRISLGRRLIRYHIDDIARVENGLLSSQIARRVAENV
jgi:hypothetical protein